MKYLIFGNGWLGNKIKDYLGDSAFLYADKITDEIFEPSFKDHDVWINTIAKTNIDWCEKNKYESFVVNTLLPYRLALSSKNHNRKYVFFSSACIFESKNREDIKFEDDTPNPQCWYSWTKAVAEKLILEASPDSLIIRPRLPLSEVPHPRNTLNKLLRYSRINDNQESMTVVEDMLPVLKDLIERDGKGFFHLVNDGTISPHELAEMLGHPHEVWSKEEQDGELEKEGRAKRVTTYVGSKRIALLPNIRARIPEIIKKFKDHENTNHG